MHGTHNFHDKIFILNFLTNIRKERKKSESSVVLTIANWPPPITLRMLLFIHNKIYLLLFHPHTHPPFQVSFTESLNSHMNGVVVYVDDYLIILFFKQESKHGVIKKHKYHQAN